MDKEHYNHLKSLIKALSNFKENFHRESFNNFTCELQRFFDHLFLYYGNPLNHSDPNQFLQTAISNGEQSSSGFLKIILNILETEQNGTNEDKLFIELCPFLPEIATLYALTVSYLQKEDVDKVFSAHTELEKYLYNYEIIQPLTEMQSFIDTIATGIFDARVLKNFEDRVKLIPYATRLQDPYNCVPWKSFDILSKMMRMGCYDALITEHFQTIKEEFQGLSQILSGIIFFERRKHDVTIEEQKIEHVEFVTIPKIAAVFEDSENIKVMLQYLEDIELNTENTQIVKFSVLRALTVLGEAAKNLSKEVKSEIPVLKCLEDIRDGIIHPRGSIKEFIKELLNHDNLVLHNLWLGDLRNLRSCLGVLLQKLLDNTIILSQPKFPHIETIVTHFTKNYKLTSQERQKLVASFPEEDFRETSEQKDWLRSILDGEQELPKNSDIFIRRLQLLGFSKSKAKGLHVKLNQAKITQLLKQEINNGSLDLTKIHELLKHLTLTAQQKTEIIKPDQSIDYENLKKVLIVHKNKVYLTTEEKQALLAGVSEAPIELAVIKKQLKDFVWQNGDMPTEAIVKKNLAMLGINGDGKDLWQHAINILFTKDEQKKEPKELGDELGVPSKVLQIREIIQNIHFIQAKLSELKDITITHTGDLIDLETFLYNKHLMRACEYLLGPCIDSMKFLSNSLLEIKDPLDIRSRLIFLKHPIDELITDIDKYIEQRNDIFHLHHIYDPAIATCYNGPDQIPFWEIPINRLPHHDFYYFIESIVYGKLLLPQDGDISRLVRMQSLVEKLSEVEKITICLETSINNFMELPYYDIDGAAFMGDDNDSTNDMQT